MSNASKWKTLPARERGKGGLRGETQLVTDDGGRGGEPVRIFRIQNQALDIFRFWRMSAVKPLRHTNIENHRELGERRGGGECGMGMGSTTSMLFAFRRGEWEENERRMRGEWEENERRLRGEWEETERRMRGEFGCCMCCTTLVADEAWEKQVIWVIRPNTTVRQATWNEKTWRADKQRTLTHYSLRYNTSAPSVFSSGHAW